jgi:ApaG protein
MSSSDSRDRERGINVHVEAHYAAHMSKPEARNWFFTYTVSIVNNGEAPARLLAREWTITDGIGVVSKVSGPGVVGETPRLEPGETFQYTSGCPLKTPFGSMSGLYIMVTDDGARFSASIPEFMLMTPGSLN